MRRLTPGVIVALAASLFVLNVADYFLTMRILELGGVEVNPLMAPIIATPLVPILKIVVVGVVCVVLAVYARTRLVVGFLVFAVGYYVMVVGWNAANIYTFYN